MNRNSRALQTWLNYHAQAMKRDCRRNERKWKKTGLHVIYETWKDSMTNHQKAVIEARTSFFSKLILANHSSPVTSPSSTPSISASQERCEDFLNHFRNRVNDTRQNITPRTKFYRPAGMSIVILAALNQVHCLFNKTHITKETSYMQP